jgi:hypothetical protein
MSLNTVSTELVMLYAIVAILFLALAGYVAVLQFRQRRQKSNIVAISTALVDYFRRTGVEVSVGCAVSNDGKRFTAFIESEPMKRFRLSHIIEMTLRDHVAKACGLELDKVYWRFPIKQVDQTTAAVASTPEKERKPQQDTDDYINEGLVHYRDLPKFDVTEIPWEKFEEATFKDTTPPSDTAPRQDGA